MRHHSHRHHIRTSHTQALPGHELCLTAKLVGHFMEHEIPLRNILEPLFDPKFY